MFVLIKRVNREYLLYLIPAIISVIEWYLLYHNDIPSAYPTIPTSVEGRYALSVMNGMAFTGIIYLLIGFPLDILTLYLGVPLTVTSTIWNFVQFEILFLGIFFSARYFLKKYFNASGLLLYLSSTLPSIPAPITWYTVSGVIYFFPGVYALTLALLDYSLDINEKISIRQLILRSAIAATAVTLDFTDPRGIVFGVLTFLFYSLYFLIIKGGKRNVYLKEWIKIFALGVLFFLLLNVDTIIYTEFIKPYIPEVGTSTVYNQLGIALQHVPPFYTLAGTMYWLGPNYYVQQYHADLIFGVLAVATAFLSLLVRRPISIFLSTITLSVVTYNYIGVVTLGYYLAQTPYVGYLVYLYPTYLPSYFYVSPFYLLVSFSFFIIGSYLYKGRYAIVRVTKTIPVFLLLLLPFIEFFYPIATAIQNQQAIRPPSAVVQSIELIAHNDTGIILVLGNSTLASFYLGLPSMLSPPSEGYMNFIWNCLPNAENYARFLAYFGIQYIVILQPSEVSSLDLFTSSPYFKLIYNKSGVLVFENTLYRKFIVQKGVYIAFNFPQVLTKLSHLNSTYVIIPFYYINDLQSVLPYIKGFIGYNLTPNDLIPMLVNNSSYIISASNINLNQYYSNGWVHYSPFWTPDILNTITEGNGVPLNLTLDIPNGEYYVYVLSVGSTLSGESVSGNIRISSGNTLDVSYSGSVYNVSWVFAGKLSLINHEIHITTNNLAIVKIVLVPTSIYTNLFAEAKSILSSREEIIIANNSIIISNGTYSPSVSAISIFSNPWYFFLPFAHVVTVKNYIYRSEYYFGTSEVYITTSYPKIDLGYPSFLPELTLNFIIDIVVLFSAFYLRKYEHRYS